MKKNILIIANIMIIAFCIRDAIAQNLPQKKKNQDTYRLLNLFGNVFERVRASYVKEITDKELIESAIKGMLNSLDPHSSYLNSENFKDMRVQTRGKFGGLGIEVTLSLIHISEPTRRTPI